MRYLIPSLARCADGRRVEILAAQHRGQVRRRQAILGAAAVVETSSEHLIVFGQVSTTRAGPLGNRRYRR